MMLRRELRGQLGRYTILSTLGTGGMGTVYRALDSKLDREVALKAPHFHELANPDVLHRFQREARLAARIEHPNLCPVYDVDLIDGIHFFTMPLIEGTPLSSLIDRDEPWQPLRAVEVVRKLALAVSALHQKGIVHRDLKPSNIMIRSIGEPVLMDFGLARLIEASHARCTQVGIVLGTPAYTAPEQLENVKEAGPSVDVYSLGVILWELLTGHPPFEGSFEQVCAQVLFTPAPCPSDERPGLDSRLDSLCEQAMVKRPEDRIATAAEFAARLEACSLPATASGRRAKIARPAPPETPMPTVLRSLPSTEAGIDSGFMPTLLKTAFHRITCWQCGKKWKIPSDTALQKFRCSQCKTPLWLPREVVNSLGMKMMLIPAGTFFMGSPEGEGFADEQPRHEVRISRHFYLGAFPVTQEEFQRVVGENPSWFSSNGGGKDKARAMDTASLPVECVSWDDAALFCKLLSRLPEEQKAGRVYRLPTEAQWEYACREGASLREQATFYQNGTRNLRSVGSGLPNAFGIFDMPGELSEWCQDWFDENYYAVSPYKNPRGPETGDSRVLRGGLPWALEESTGISRATCRLKYTPETRDFDIGFRVCMTLDV